MLQYLVPLIPIVICLHLIRKHDDGHGFGISFGIGAPRRHPVSAPLQSLN
ncbi:MAG: hypothetical protein WDN06_19200 [Asticcacaulis sp.]